MKFAIVFDNYGPYHWARLEAAARYGDMLAIEVAHRSNEYAWNRKDSEPTSYDSEKLKDRRLSFQYECLFDGTSNQISAKQMYQKMAGCLDSVRPEFVFIPGWYSRAAIAALHWCLLKRVPAVVMSESTQWDERRNPFREWIKRRIVSCFSAALVGGTPHAEYLEQLRFPRNRICLGYDAVDNDYFRKQAAEIRAKADLIRREHGLPHHFFLASARFIEKKNLAGLLTAFAQYRKKHELEHRATATDSWHLVLLGDGELRTDLEQLRAQLGLDRAVHMPGFKQYEDLPRYYGTANAFVHASTTEQWGLVVNEAMASGLPVIVSNRCGCARDLVHENINGFTFDPDNTYQLSQLMLRIASLPAALLKRFGDASQQIIVDWGPDRFAAGVRECSQIATNSGKPRCSVLSQLIVSALSRR